MRPPICNNTAKNKANPAVAASCRLVAMPAAAPTAQLGRKHTKQRLQLLNILLMRAAWGRAVTEAVSNDL